MKHLFLAMLIALAGCARDNSDAHIYPGLFGQNIIGNQAYVTVTNVWNEMDALPLADGHCYRFGRVARYNRMEGSRAIFDCIPP